MARTEAEYEHVKALAELGLSDYAIAALTGRTSGNRAALAPPKKCPDVVTRSAGARSWSVTDGFRYCYLLGCYLGDGHLIHRPPNSWILRVSCDRRYPSIKEEILAAMKLAFPVLALLGIRHPAARQT